MNLSRLRPLSYLYPLLFAANQVIFILLDNLDYVPEDEILLPLLTVLLAGGLLLGILYLLLRNGHRASFVAMLVIIWFAYTGGLVDFFLSLTGIPATLLNKLLITLVWTAFFILMGSNWIWRKVQSPQTITLYMNILVICLLSVSLYRYASFKWVSSPPRLSASHVPTLQPERRPDVYYIILDGYARADVLNELYSFDNSAFLDALRSRGFYVAEASQSNYPQTAFSLASSLNMAYIPETGSSSISRAPLKQMIEDNAVMQAFYQGGYKVIAMPSGYQFTTIDNPLFTPDRSNLSRMTDRTRGIEGLWMMNTALRLFFDQGWIELPFKKFEDMQQLALRSLDELVHIAADPQPTFAFLHVLSPHPPFLFDRNGPVSPEQYYIAIDGKYAIPNYASGYLSDLQYVNQLVLQAVDDILQASADPPIIILQGDHGPGSLFDFGSVEESCIFERISIFNAYLLPDSSVSQFPYPSITPVNTFRGILRTYFNANLDLLEDRSYFATYDRPYQFVPVGSEDKQNCFK